MHSYHFPVESRIQRRKILVVDDDPEVRLALRIRLQANHYDVVFAEDGVTGISKAREHNPELVLLDLGLPCGDGFTVMERLKEYENLSSIPIIVISGRNRKANRDPSLQAGARAFLQQPVDNAHMLSVIAYCLDKTRTEQVYDLGLPQALLGAYRKTV